MTEEDKSVFTFTLGVVGFYVLHVAKRTYRYPTTDNGIIFILYIRGHRGYGTRPRRLTFGATEANTQEPP
jgi:hypothetical protein